VLAALLVAHVAFGLLAMTICIPSMQDWLGQFAATQTAVQVSFGGYIAGYGFLQLVYGPVSDRIGRRPVLLAGLFIACSASLMAALANELWLLNLSRVVQGAGCAAGAVVGRAMVQDLFQGTGRTRVMAWIGVAMGVCPPVAMLIGGYMHASYGWRANFILLAGLAAVLTLITWRLLPREDRNASGAMERRSWRHVMHDYGSLFKNADFRAYIWILAGAVGTFYIFLGGAPQVLANYGLQPQEIGWYMVFPSVAYIFGNLSLQRLLRLGVPERRLMHVGQLLGVLGPALVFVGALIGLDTPAAAVVPMFLLGFGHGLLIPPALVATVALMTGLAGAAAAVVGVSQQLVGALGGVVVGWLPLTGAAYFGALMLLLSGLGGWVYLRMQRSAGRGDAGHAPLG